MPEASQSRSARPQSKRVERITRRHGTELHIYPNVIYICEHDPIRGPREMAFTPEQWAEMVARAGIAFMDAEEALR